MRELFTVFEINNNRNNNRNYEQANAGILPADLVPSHNPTA